MLSTDFQYVLLKYSCININCKEFVLLSTNSNLKSLQFDNTALATVLALALPLAGNLFCFSTTLCDLVVAAY